MSRAKETEKEEVMKEWLLHIFNIQTKKNKKTNKYTRNKQKNKLEKYTNNTKQTYKQKKPQNTNKINFCSYNLISYRYIDIDTVFHHKQQIFLWCK